MIPSKSLLRGSQRLLALQKALASSSPSSNHLPASTKASSAADKKEQSQVLKRMGAIDNHDVDNLRPSMYPGTLDFIDTRQVRISKPSKNVMQSGTASMQSWKIEFDSKMRWENWLMGWTSTGDPLSNLSLSFTTKEDAIVFCDKQKLNWYVEEQPERKKRKKSYADNYSWDKRTRTTNK